MKLTTAILTSLLLLGICENSFANTWEGSFISGLRGRVLRAIPIYQVHLYHDKGSLTILKVVKKRGRAPKAISGEGEYMIELVNDETVVARRFFDIPWISQAPPPWDGGGPAHFKIEVKHFGIVLPAYPADTLRITKEDDIVAEYDLTKAVKQKNKSRFRSKSAGNLGFLPRFGIAEAAGSEVLDISFVSDKYKASDENQFNLDVDRAINHMLTYDPFLTRASQIMFHRVFQTEDLLCQHSSTMPRLITCNNTRVTTAVTDAQAPYDKIIVLVKDSSYGGSGGTIAVAYNGSSSAPMVVHEFAHSFASLLDEYVLYSRDGAISNKANKNCYMGVPSSEWSQTPTIKCYYQNWYRPAPCSIMLKLSCQNFNEVSQQILNDKLDVYAGPFTGNQSPIVSLTAMPVSGNAPLTVLFTATATDPEGGSLNYVWSL